MTLALFINVLIIIIIIINAARKIMFRSLSLGIQRLSVGGIDISVVPSETFLYPDKHHPAESCCTVI